MKEEIIDTLLDELDVEIVEDSQECKAPCIVVGEEDGNVVITTHTKTRQEAIGLRDKVKALLTDYAVCQGIIEFNSIDIRFWQKITILKQE